MKTLLLLMFILVGCEKSGTSEHTLFQAAPSIEGGVDFATLNSFILKPMCLRCHAWAGDENQVRSRIVVGNPDASSLYVRMANGSMPQGGPAATSAQLEVVAAYINGPIGPNPNPNPNPNPTPGFATLSSTILQPLCIGCHAWAGNEAQVQTRIVAGNPNASSLYVRMANGSMPQGGPPLNAQQLQVVADYINGPIVPVPTIELKPTYESLKVHLFEKSCTMCHNANSSRLDDFTKYSEIRDEIEDIEEQLDFGTMPPLDNQGNPRAPVPTQEVLDTFRNWVRLGMPRS